MKKTLLLSALVLSLAACTQSLPAQGTPTTGTSTPAEQPVVMVNSDPTPLPMPQEPPAASPTPDQLCHAILYPQSQYGDAATTIIQFGPSCPAGQYLQLGLFAGKQGLHTFSPPRPDNGVDIVRADWQITVTGTYGQDGYQVATRLQLNEYKNGAYLYSDWYDDAYSFVPGQ